MTNNYLRKSWYIAMDTMTSCKRRGKMGIKWAKRIPTDQKSQTQRRIQPNYILQGGWTDQA